MNSVTGWVYWREAPGDRPRWRFGTVTGLQSGLSFAEADAPPGERGPWILPGMVDVHNHLSIGPSGPDDDEEALQSAGLEIASGVLALREMGNPVPGRAIPGGVPFPKLVGAGQHIARPMRYLPRLAIEVANPSDLPTVVAEQAALGEGWVKLVGDWIDRSQGADSDLDPLWELPELRDAVAAAHEGGARVAVHTFGAKAIPDLLEAGIDSIEHGTGMNREQLQEAAFRGIPVTPTLGQAELFPTFAKAAQKYPVYAKTMTDLFERKEQWWEDLMDSGVQLLPGTDAGGYQPHGELVRELTRWQDMGLDATSVVDFATWQARDFLGFAALEPGSPADFLVLEEDPTVDLGTLSAPQRIFLDGAEV